MKIDNSTLCIQCGCCSSACPVVWNNGQYYGPAALTRAYRFIFDTRRSGRGRATGAERVGGRHWRCHTIFNCTSDCPKGVLNTQNIQALKRKIMLQNLGFGGTKMLFEIGPSKPEPLSETTASARNADAAGHHSH